MLNEIKLKISGPKHLELKFSLLPFLAPSEAEEHKQIKRLPPPVLYHVLELPHKIKTVIKTSTSEQALVGDPFRVNINILKEPDILLTDIKA